MSSNPDDVPSFVITQLPPAPPRRTTARKLAVSTIFRNNISPEKYSLLSVSVFIIPVPPTPPAPPRKNKGRKARSPSLSSTTQPSPPKRKRGRSATVISPAAPPDMRGRPRKNIRRHISIDCIP